MPIVAARALARVIDISSTKLGVPLPKAYLATLAQAQRLITETEQLEAGAGELTSRACELILKGDDPRTDPQIARLLAQRGLAANGIRVAGADRGQGLITAALVEHADEILSGWAEELTADCATLTAAAEVLDHVADLAGAELSQLKRSGHLNLWSAALSASDRLRVAHDGFKAIATALGVQREYRVLAFTDDLDAALAVNAVVVGSATPDCWDVARVGARLSLATVSSFVERIGSYTADQQARYLAHEEASRRTGFDDTAPRREAAVI